MVGLRPQFRPRRSLCRCRWCSGVRALARRRGLVAKPRADRWHSKPTALFGGVGIFAAFASGRAVCARARTSAGDYLLLAGCAGMFLVGLLDDFVTLKPYAKLVGQIVFSAAFTVFGVRLRWLNSAVLDQVLTIFWLVGIANAVNLLDNLDGLAGGRGRHRLRLPGLLLSRLGAVRGGGPGGGVLRGGGRLPGLQRQPGLHLHGRLRLAVSRASSWGASPWCRTRTRACAATCSPCWRCRCCCCSSRSSTPPWSPSAGSSTVDRSRKADVITPPTGWWPSACRSERRRWCSGAWPPPRAAWRSWCASWPGRSSILLVPTFGMLLLFFLIILGRVRVYERVADPGRGQRAGPAADAGRPRLQAPHLRGLARRRAHRGGLLRRLPPSLRRAARRGAHRAVLRAVPDLAAGGRSSCRSPASWAWACTGACGATPRCPIWAPCCVRRGGLGGDRGDPLSRCFAWRTCPAASC